MNERLLSLKSLGSPVEPGTSVESVALEVPNVRVSMVANLVNSANRRAQYILVGSDRLRYDQGLEDLVRSTSYSFVGRDITNLRRRQFEPNQATIDFTDGVVQTARHNAPDTFRRACLGALLDVQYFDDDPDPNDVLPHPDWVSDEPTAFGLGSVALHNQARFDASRIFMRHYVWHGSSQTSKAFGQYIEAACGMEQIDAQPDAMYVGDGRILLHAGPAEVNGPRVLARVYAAPLDSFISLNCHN